MKSSNAIRTGFSLVELSIVLVILGLLVGGVLSGQSLIRAAELRSVSTEFSKYKTAEGTFRDKYFGLPGDITNATQFWGSAYPADPVNCKAVIGTGTQTCDGDGNGIIDGSAYSYEYLRFWQHLANAGLIEGQYTGYKRFAANMGADVTTVPSGRIGSSLWTIIYGEGVPLGNAYGFAGVYGNTFSIGTNDILDGPPVGPIFTPAEAWNIDTKLDDGQPGTGSVVYAGLDFQGSPVVAATACTDATNGHSLSANYLLSTSATTCALFFRNAF